MNRPKKEELKDIREIGGIYTIDFTRYNVVFILKNLLSIIK